MDTMTDEAVRPLDAESEAVLAAHTPRRGLARRLAARLGGILAVVAAFLCGGVGVASAAPLPTPSDLPDAQQAITEAGSTVSNQLTNTFVALLPYIIALMVLFTGYLYLRHIFGAKKRPH